MFVLPEAKVQVGIPVAGSGVFICHGCVPGREVTSAGPSARPTLAPWELASHKGEVLVALPRVVAAGAQAERERDPVGDRARSLGVPGPWVRRGPPFGDAPGHEPPVSLGALFG